MSFYAQQHTSGIQVEHTRHKMRFTLDSIRSHQKIGSMLIESFKLLFSKGHPRIRDIVFFFRLNDENVTLSAQMLWLDMFAKSDWTPFVAIFFLVLSSFFPFDCFFFKFPLDYTLLSFSISNSFVISKFVLLRKIAVSTRN